MFQADLSAMYEEESKQRFASIGWLDNEHAFEKSEIDPYFLERLWQFVNLSQHCAKAMDWGACGGGHTCELCRKYGDSGEIGVPGDNVLYIAPRMVAHYVEEHSYCPPTEFVDAVMTSPLPGTEQYTAQVARYKW